MVDVRTVIGDVGRTVDELEIRFTEQEVAQILWVLSEASDLANAADALSSLAMIEGTLRAWCANDLIADVPSSPVSLAQWPSASR